MEDAHKLIQKVENSENETGKSIRRIRLSRKLSGDALAQLSGLKKSALLHYEKGIRSVSEDALTAISTALDIPSCTLRARHIESVADAMQVLFQLEQIFGLRPNSDDERISFASDSLDLAAGIAAWQTQYEKYIAGTISEEEYQDWKDRFPLQYEASALEQQNDSDDINNIDPNWTELARSDARYKRNGIMRLKTYYWHYLSGLNGTYIPAETISRICRYVNCSEQYLNDESCVEFKPEAKRSPNSVPDNQTLSDILGIMDKNADTEFFRVVQIQLSRIVIYNLKEKGFDRETLRVKEFVTVLTDYLFTGEKSKLYSIYVGFDFTHLNLIREITGMSFEEMFTGICS